MSDIKKNVSVDLLSRGHSPDTTSRIYNEQIAHKPLYIRPASSDLVNARTKRQQERTLKKLSQHKSHKPKPLSAKQKRALGTYEIPKEQKRYDIYIPLWRMWCSYIRDVLGLKIADENSQFGGYILPQGVGPLLTSADFHGAEMQVVRSRCVTRVGIRGIVVKDTKFTFDIITAKNELKTVPKEHTIFRFEIPLREQDTPNQISQSESKEDKHQKKAFVFELHGERFMTKAPDRATKKFGLHLSKDL